MRKPRKIKSQSKGSLALNHCGASTEEIAKAVGVRVNMVNWWRSGERKPAAGHRWELRQKYAIAGAAWDEPIDETDPLAGITKRAALQEAMADSGMRAVLEALPDKPPERRTTPKEILDEGGELLEQCRWYRRTVETDKLMTLEVKGRYLRDAAITLEKAAKITGANGDIPVSKIVRSPAWARLAGVITDALAADPDALQKVVDAIKGAGM